MHGKSGPQREWYMTRDANVVENEKIENQSNQNKKHFFRHHITNLLLNAENPVCDMGSITKDISTPCISLPWTVTFEQYNTVMFRRREQVELQPIVAPSRLHVRMTEWCQMSWVFQASSSGYISSEVGASQ